MCAMIAVIDRTRLEDEVRLQNSFWSASQTMIGTLEPLFVPHERALAEVDPSLKQPIVYAVVRRGDDVFVMERLAGGGEKRLHGACSVGVGGHVDAPFAASGALGGALRQEWSEEVSADFHPEFRFIGFVNDDSIEVGRVHIGFVFEVVAPLGARMEIRETDKLSGCWMSLNEALDSEERFETWSLFVLRYLAGRDA
jgi:predicted NUDIX family phosphoesterase